MNTNKVIPMRTKAPDDPTMHRLCAYQAIRLLRECLLCEQALGESETPDTVGIYVPNKENAVIDGETGKTILFGYGLCPEHDHFAQENLEYIEDMIKAIARQ